MSCQIGVPMCGNLDGSQARMLLGHEYDVLESTAYYEGYRPVLQALQNICKSSDITNCRIPLAEYIIDGQTQENLPEYLRQGEDEKPVLLDFSSVVRGSCRDRFTAVPVTDYNAWPTADHLKLDTGREQNG